MTIYENWIVMMMSLMNECGKCRRSELDFNVVIETVETVADGSWGRFERIMKYYSQ